MQIAGSKKFSVTHTHATAAKAEQAATAEKRHYITDIAGSSDKAGSIILVTEDSGGASEVVRYQITVGVGNFHHSFDTPLIITVATKVSVEIDGTASCKANIGGFTV